MPTRLCRILCCLAPLHAGCAAGRVTERSPDPARPHVSWEIRAGGDLGDARRVCAWSDPAPSCVLQASTDADRRLATVRVSFHPAKTGARYLGYVRVPFVRGTGALDTSEISRTVPPGSSPVSRSINGVVTTKPGSYELTLALDAILTGSSEPVRIADEIPVTVTAATPENSQARGR